ncbi:hypothetical protein [Winogradskyella sp. UBA3174]|uniref:hypothetical protein n=1 Tax=Winogradskyella sp. UBA3174 TaxID=1947785 RepID=UPI0025ED1F2C|nr:hypothetical protein [Winogradskyella sp. UBA3174]|tara:strand:- start:6635 stop:6892 length:258 start_codon:yes stop_codon:yes gene_type:complete
MANVKAFDLIIVDLYIDLVVPGKFHNLRSYPKIKTLKGHSVFNASVTTNKPKSSIDNITSFLQSKVYATTVYKKVNNTNIIASGL